MLCQPVDLAKLDRRLPALADDNEPALVRIDEAKGFIEGNVTVVSRRAERILDLCSPEQRASVMRAIQHGKPEGNA